MRTMTDYKSRFRILKNGKIALIISGMMITISSATDISTTVIVNSASVGTNGTNALLSHNGTPMVNIAKPTATGLSKNYYDKFNIENNGLLLNNMTKTGQTQLAGYELPNLNLGVGKNAVAAKAILNEVKSTAPTTFNGYIEVGGNKAAVILANPNGISINGGGFINASRATLVTGSSNLNTAGDTITGFTIGNNALSIASEGLNAKDTTSTDIVAKNISIDGQINATILNLMGGVNSYDYITNTGATTDTTATTTYSIDASAFGGMYANAITIKATNAGLGVKIASESGALAGDFSIDSLGKVLVSGKISAVKNTDIEVAATQTEPATTVKASEIDGNGDIKITARNTATDGFKLDKGTLTSKGNVEFNVGGFTLEGGQIKASNTLKVDATSLTDTKETSTVAGINTRSADNLINIKLSGAHTMGSDISYIADKTITYDVGSANIGGALYSKDGLSITTSGEFASGTTGTIVSDKAFSVNAGSINNSGKLTTNSTTEILNLTSIGAFANSGNILGPNGLIVSSGALNNTGEISNTSGDVSLTASSITNSNLLKSANALTLASASVSNSSPTAEISGKTVTFTGTTTLGNSGNLFTTQGDISLTNATTITNSGIVKSAGALRLSSTNLDSSTGGFNAAGAISLAGTSSLKTGDVSNTAGDISLTTSATLTNSKTVKSAGKLTIDANGLTNESTGALGSTTDMTLTNVKTLTNAGKIINGSGDISLVGADAITNSGTIKSANNLTLEAAAFSSTAGNINAAKTISLKGTTSFENGGNILNDDSSSDVTITAGSFTNSSNIVSAKDLFITASSTVNNNGLILGTHDLTLSGATTIYNSSVGAFVASNALSLGGSGELSNAGTLYSDKDMTLTASSITNSATLANGGGITTAEMLTTTGNFTNSGDTWAKNSTMSGATFENSGTFSIANDTTMNYTTSWKNTKNVSIGHDATITTGEFTNGSGEVVGGEVINLGMKELYALGTTGIFSHSQQIGYIADWDMAAISNYITKTRGPNTPEYYTYADIFKNPSASINLTSFYNDAIDFAGTYDPTSSFGWGSKYVSDGKTLGYFAGRFTYLFNAGEGSVTSGMSQSGTNYFNLKIGYDPSSVASTAMANLNANNTNGTINVNFTHGKNYGVMSANDINLGGTGTFKNVSVPSGYKIIRYKVEYDMWGGNLTYDSTETVAGSSSGGGIIKANSTVNFNGFDLEIVAAENTSVGSKSANTKTNSATASGDSVSAVASTVTGKNSSLLDITTPTNPNGQFVPSKNPNSQFLVESNPAYGSKAKYLGSDYLMKALGIDPTMQTVKLLGDAAYEAKMIEKQLTEKTGNALLKGMSDAGTQIKSMYDNAAVEAGALGLKFGEAPTPAQLANLKSDMVWMVKTVVNGVEVLAPQVYLAPTTIASLAINEESGTIAAKDMNMDLKSLSNTGGTIKGTDNLNIKAKGDITNTSGTITGGNVAVESTEGNIKNETMSKNVTTQNGGNIEAGKTATISSTKDMSLKAAKDITVKGAAVSAGGSLKATAGGKLNVKALDTKTQGKGVNYSTDVAGSTISSGKDMALSSKGDMNIEASKIKASGNLDMKTEGDMNIVAKESTNFDHQSSGNNVKNTTTTTNKGSSIESGGDANLKAANDITLQGSSVDAKGDLATEATNINILAGKNTVDSSDLTTTSNTVKKESGNWFSGKKEESTTTTKTTGTISKESNSVASSLKSGGNMKLKAANDITVQGSNVDAGGNVDMGAANVNILGAQNTKTSTTIDKTEVGSEKSSYGVLTGGYSKEWKNKTTDTQTVDAESKNAGSTIKSGGNMNIKAANDVTVQGSKTEAGKNLTMEGTNINVLAGKDTKTTDTKTTTDEQTKKISVGIGGVSFGMEFKKGESKENTDASTAQVSTTKAGKDITKTAANKITDEGTQIDAGGNYTQKADTIENKAAKNTYTESKESSEKTIGFEVGITTSASLKAGVKYSQGSEKSNVDASQAVVSNIKAGGNVNSTSTNKTTMEGTNIQAGKDVNIEAKSLDILQATDKLKSSESSNGFNVSAGIEVGSSGLKGANVGFGMKNSKESLETSTAQTSTLSSGGKMNIKTAEDIKMQGTNLQSAGDTNIAAGGNVTMEAARNTEKSNNTGFNVGVGLSLDMGTDKAKKSQGINLDAGFATGKTNNNQAVTGSMQSGGNLNIKSGNNVTLEGVEIDAAGKTKVDAAGDVNLKAAESTVDSSQFGLSVGVAATLGGGRQGEALPSTENLTGVNKAKQSVKNAIDDKKDGIKSSGVSPVGFGLNIGIEKGKDYKSTTINSSNGLEINAGGKVKQEEGIVDALTGGSISGGQGGTKINAAGGVEKDTKFSYDLGIDMNINAGKDATKDGIKGGK